MTTMLKTLALGLALASPAAAFDDMSAGFQEGLRTVRGHGAGQRAGAGLSPRNIYDMVCGRDSGALPGGRALKDALVKSFRKKLSAGKPLAARDFGGGGIMHEAASDLNLHSHAKGGHCHQLLAALVESGVAVDMKDKDGRTALHDAAQFSGPAYEILLSLGASETVQDRKGLTPKALRAAVAEAERRSREAPAVPPDARLIPLD